MSVAEPPVTAARPGLIRRIVRYAACLFAVLILIVALFNARMMSAPDAPLAWGYAALALAGLTLLAQLPFIYFRLSKTARQAASLMLPVTVVLVFVAEARMEPTWSTTAEGKQEAADQHQREQRMKAEEAAEANSIAATDAAARSQADTEAAQKQLSELTSRLERCFTSWGHRLPALEDPVKESLHNPSAFEHIETVLIVPDNDSNNVVMRFRAENGFGALRTGQVLAQLIADDCSVQNIRELTID